MGTAPTGVTAGRLPGEAAEERAPGGLCRGGPPGGPLQGAQEGLCAGQQASSLKNSGGERRCGEDLGVVMGDLDG